MKMVHASVPPPRRALCLRFPTPRGLQASVSSPRGAPGLSFPTTGGLRASVSPPHSGCRMDSTRSRSRPHPAAPIGSCKRTGDTLASPSPPGSCDGAGGHPRTPRPWAAVKGRGGTLDSPPHAPQSGLRDPLRTGASLRLLYVCPHPWPPCVLPIPSTQKYQIQEWGLYKGSVCVGTRGRREGHA